MTVEALGLGAIEILVIWHICGGVIVDNVGYHADVPAAETSTPTLAKPLKIHEESIKKKPEEAYTDSKLSILDSLYLAGRRSISKQSDC